MRTRRLGELPRVILITDRHQLRAGLGLRRTLLQCAEAGLTQVVLRELDLPDARRSALAAGLTEAGLTVIAAHRPLPGAAGVHLPSFATMTPAGPGLVGRSCHSREEVTKAAGEGADYVTLSPFARTASKPGYGPPLLAAEYAGHPLPVYALGGVTPGNAAAARDAGAYGVAVMGAVMRADDPGAVAAALLEAVR